MSKPPYSQGWRASVNTHQSYAGGGCYGRKKRLLRNDGKSPVGLDILKSKKPRADIVEGVLRGLAHEIGPGGGRGNGYLFGFLLFDVIRYGMDQDKATRGVYLLSDFVIASRIRRLSKLLLLSTKTKELQDLLKEKFIQPVEFILTTAFTDKPV